MVKLTPDLINQSMQFINPCRERELDLRGYKIPQIENLGATLDQFDTIDLSDNDLRKLDGLPYLPRLKCLLLNNNRILRIGELHDAVPNLSSVILTGNNLQELGDLEPLSLLPHLDTICLLVNPVSTKAYYREYMAYRFPQLRLLDFRKIRQKDRRAAQEYFRTKQGKEMLKEIAKKSKLSAAAAASATDGANGVAKSANFRAANPDDLQRIRRAITKANSLKEVEYLAQILESGQIPDDFQMPTENGVEVNGGGGAGNNNNNGGSAENMEF